MLNEEKIRIMTKLAVFEDKNGKDDLKLSKYYKTDYIRLQLLKTLLCATIGYIIALLLVGIYHLEYLVAKAVVLDYKAIGGRILGIFIIMAVIYAFTAMIAYSFRFERSRKKLRQYKKNLKELRQYYKKAEAGEE